MGFGPRPRGPAAPPLAEAAREGRPVEAPAGRLLRFGGLPAVARRRGFVRRELPVHGVAEGDGPGGVGGGGRGAWGGRAGAEEADGEEVHGGFRIGEGGGEGEKRGGDKAYVRAGSEKRVGDSCGSGGEVVG